MVFSHLGVGRTQSWLCRPGGLATCFRAREASFHHNRLSPRQIPEIPRGACCEHPPADLPARLPAPGHPSPLPEEPSVPATALTLLGCLLGLGLQCGQIGQEALKWGRGTERAGRSGSKTRSHIETSALCAQTGPESGPLPCISAAQAGWD